MSDRATAGELRARIQRDITHYGGTLPERVAIAWAGYLAALIEWGLISVDEHAELFRMLPPVQDHPAIDILLGRE